MNPWILIVYSPRRFFRQLFERRLDLWVPLGIVLSASWLRYIAYGVWTRNLPPVISTEMLQSLAAESGGIPLWICLIFVGLLSWPLLSWGIHGWIIQLITGSHWRAWQLAGWTQCPLVVVGLMTVGAATLWPASNRVMSFTQYMAFRPEAPKMSQYLAWLQLYSQSLSGQVFLQVLFWCVLAGSLWSLWLLYWGVKSLAPQKAVLTTSILTLWTMIWRVL